MGAEYHHVWPHDFASMSVEPTLINTVRNEAATVHARPICGVNYQSFIPLKTCESNLRKLDRLQHVDVGLPTHSFESATVALVHSLLAPFTFNALGSCRSHEHTD
jgi:hypothetical protein